MKKLLIFIALFVFPLSMFAEFDIEEIFLERKNVYDSTQRDWFFAAELMNSLHTVTKPYLIEDELIFDRYSPATEDMLLETERNLWATGLFTDVRIELDSAGYGRYDAYVVTQDRWSLLPSLLFGTGGNTTNYGGRIEEMNLAGTGTHILAEALHRSENNIGWQGAAEFEQRRLFRSELSFSGNVLANKYRTEQYLTLEKPFRTISTVYSYGLNGVNLYGKDFLYNKDETHTLMPFKERSLTAWFSRAWQRKGRVFATALLHAEDIERTKPEYKQAYDNSGRFLLAFSSVSEDYIKLSKLNSYYPEYVPEGGWGTAVLGKTFAIGSHGESLYYIAAQGEKSYIWNNLYLFGQISGASAFRSSRSLYTYQEFLGLGFYRFSPDMLLAARIRQQTVWRWSPLRQLVLDNEGGLRGYPANKLSGDNRFVSNLEFRAFPDIELWIIKISSVAFWDAGTVWNQNTDLAKTRWHHSVGAGIRIENTKTSGKESILRIDFAFNLDENRFAEIIFTSDQLFSIFKSHEFRLPEVYGLEFDYE